MNIIAVPDASVGAAPAAFTTAVNYVVNLLDNLFTNSLTIYIAVGWGEINGQKLGKDDLGESLAQNYSYYSYAQVRNALIANAQSPAQLSAYATLPASDPTNGDTIELSTANAEILGLEPPSSGFAGYVGFSSGVDWSYAPNVTPAANAYYFIGVVEHEITEVLGRVSFPDYPNDNDPGLMDLFRYSAAGVRDLTPAPPQPYAAAYFSTDGGVTDLGDWNTNPNQDLGDWAPNVANDAFLAESYPGVVDSLTSTDIALMNVLGYDSAITVSGGQTDTVSAGMTTTGAIVLASGTQTVASGGSAVGTIVSSGGTAIVHAGGAASGMTLSAGGAEYVGGADSGATVYGFQDVTAGGHVGGASFLAGGGETISAGGVASGVTIDFAGYEYIESGGLVSGVTLLGYQEVDSDGVASNVTVSGGGCETVAAGGSAGEVTVAYGGYEYVRSGAIASGVELGGYQEVDSGGSASDVTVSSGACETVAAGGSAGAVTVDHGGYEYVLSGAVASGVELGGYQEVDRGGSANSVTVSSGACETVEAGASAGNVVIDQGGYSLIEAGALSGATVFGYQQVDGGTVSNVTLSSGGGQNVYAGGIVDGVTVALGASEFVYSGTVSGGTVLGYQEIDGHGAASGLTVSSGGTEAVLSGGGRDEHHGRGRPGSCVQRGDGGGRVHLCRLRRPAGDRFWRGVQCDDLRLRGRRQAHPGGHRLFQRHDNLQRQHAQRDGRRAQRQPGPAGPVHGGGFPGFEHRRGRHDHHLYAAAGPGRGRGAGAGALMAGRYRAPCFGDDTNDPVPSSSRRAACGPRSDKGCRGRAGDWRVFPASARRVQAGKWGHRGGVRKDRSVRAG